VLWSGMNSMSDCRRRQKLEEGSVGVAAETFVRVARKEGGDDGESS